MAGKKGKHREGSADDHSDSQPERTFDLNWESISKTRQDFVDTNCILSILCFQLGGNVLDDDDVEQSPDTEATEVDDDASDLDDGVVNMWESDLTNRYDEHNSVLSQAVLKSRFLDRLTEVLARVKKPPEAMRQVAGAYMAEKDNVDGSQLVEIRLAKNGGLSVEDDEYLKSLFGVLMQLAQGGTATRLG